MQLSGFSGSDVTLQIGGVEKLSVSSSFRSSILASSWYDFVIASVFRESKVLRNRVGDKN